MKKVFVLAVGIILIVLGFSVLNGQEAKTTTMFGAFITATAGLALVKNTASRSFKTITIGVVVVLIVANFEKMHPEIKSVTPRSTVDTLLELFRLFLGVSFAYITNWLLFPRTTEDNGNSI